MSGIMDLLTSQLSGGTLKQISSQLGVDEKTTGNATGAAVGTLIAALSRNAAKPDGAEALSNALSKDHDGSILNQLQSHIQKPEQGPGAGILRHVLGGKQQTVEMGLSKATGLDTAKAGQLLTMLAPIVMGALGQAKKKTGMDAGALAGYLGAESKQLEAKQPQAAGMLGRLLDADGDGDFDLGDITKHVGGRGGFLGKLFGK